MAAYAAVDANSDKSQELAGQNAFGIAADVLTELNEVPRNAFIFVATYVYS